jgi:hypothetical protein
MRLDVRRRAGIQRYANVAPDDHARVSRRGCALRGRLRGKQ